MRGSATIFIALLLAALVRGQGLGVDISGPTSVSDFDCLIGAGYSFVIARGYQSNGVVDTNAPTEIANALAAGMTHADLYLFPCPTCGNGAGQVSTMVNYMSSHNVKYGTIWLDIEGSQYWLGSDSANQAFYASLVSACTSLNLQCGVYSSQSQWTALFGENDFNSGDASNWPLWYAHYDGVTAFSDYVEFGGWSAPAMKQYAGDVYVCNAGVDQDWYASAQAVWGGTGCNNNGLATCLADKGGNACYPANNCLPPGSCSVNGVVGTCKENTGASACSGGSFVAGYCSGDATNECCVPNAAPTASAAPPSCSTGSATGQCLTTTACSAKGYTSTAGFCSGAADIECCTAPPPTAAPASCKIASGATGTCISTTACAALAKVSTAGYCSGASNIQCCTTAPAPNVCTYNSVEGTCAASTSACTSSGGTTYSSGTGCSSGTSCCIANTCSQSQLNTCLQYGGGGACYTKYHCTQPASSLASVFSRNTTTLNLPGYIDPAGSGSGSSSLATNSTQTPSSSPTQTPDSAASSATVHVMTTIVVLLISALFFTN